MKIISAMYIIVLNYRTTRQIRHLEDLAL